MFSSALRSLDTAYIQNGYYGTSALANPFSSSYYGGSLFMIPSYSWFNGGCCVPRARHHAPYWGNRYFDMLMSIQLFSAAMNSLSNLSSNTRAVSRSKSSSSAVSLSSNSSSNSYVFNPSLSSSYTYVPDTSTVTDTSTSSASSSNSHSKLSRKELKNFTISTKTDLTSSLKDSDYNSRKGKKLAKAALSNVVGFTGYCAKYVRMALEKTGLSNGLKADAADYNEVLNMNKNFKEISTAGLDLSSLPAGCILVYDRGQSGYSSEYGHVEITTGGGQAVSDGITTDIKDGARVYIPV